LGFIRDDPPHPRHPRSIDTLLWSKHPFPYTQLKTGLVYGGDTLYIQLVNPSVDVSGVGLAHPLRNGYASLSACEVPINRSSLEAGALEAMCKKIC